MSSLIRKSPDHWLCAPTRSLSQLITSFIGSWCQGIHHAPFVAWPIFIWLFFHNQNSVLTIFQVKTIQSFFQSFAFNITKNISWLTSQYVWSYILSFYMQFSKNIMVGLNGLEPSTSRLSGVRSNQLSYRPIHVFFYMEEILPKLNRTSLSP